MYIYIYVYIYIIYIYDIYIYIYIISLYILYIWHTYINIHITWHIYIYNIYIIYIYIIYIYIYIYPHTRVSSFPGLINVARVNEKRTTDVTRVLKAPGAELCQNACGVVNEQKIFCSHQCSPQCSMNKFRAYISIYIYDIIEKLEESVNCNTSIASKYLGYHL